MKSNISSRTVRIFVASTPSEWLPMRVLEYSIKEKTELQVELSAIYKFNRTIPIPQEIKNRSRTPFSFQRFIIPELCHYKGRAIYMDADMQVFCDIKKLWEQDFFDCDLQTVQVLDNKRKGQFSVMLLDCNSLKWNIEEIVDNLNNGSLNYNDLMYEMKIAKNIGRNIKPEWNSLEYFNKEKTCLLHYTDMNTQPWVSLGNPLGYLWVSCLRRAIIKNYISIEDIENQVECEHIRPSLIAQLNTKIDDTLKLPENIRKLDKNFSAPYKQLLDGRKIKWLNMKIKINSILRRLQYSLQSYR